MEIITPETEWTAGLLTTAAIEFKLLDTAADEGLIEGYGATFNGVDYGNDTIAPGAFADSIAAHIRNGSAPAMLWNHRTSEPVGKWTGIGEDGHGLRVRGMLNRETPAGRKAHSHVKAGDVTGLSMGFTVPRGGSTANGSKRTLTKVHVHEVSLTPVPEDPRARIISVKSISSRAELEDVLREAGVPRAASRKIAVGGWPALAGGADDEESQRSFTAIVKALDRNILELKGLKL